MQWGRYRLEVSSGDRSGPVTSVAFDAGFYAEASADTPDLLEIALDKPEYAPGDTHDGRGHRAHRRQGHAQRRSATGCITTHRRRTCRPAPPRSTLPVGSDWGTGAYVVATLRRPLDAPAQRMPGRAIGVQWFAIDRKARTLALDMQLPQLMRPNSDAAHSGARSAGSRPARRRASSSPRSMSASSTSPTTSRRRRTTIISASAGSPPKSRDLYGQLIDGMQGTRGQIRTGGDAAAAELQGSPPTQAPLALYSGIVTVGAGRHRRGRVRHSGLRRHRARDGGGVDARTRSASAVGDVIVRDPVVLTATLPRFLLTGDRGTMHLDLDNVEGPAGDYRDRRCRADGRRRRRQARRRRCVSTPSSAAR